MSITIQQFNGPGLEYIINELSRFGGIRQLLLGRVKGSGKTYVYWPSPIGVSSSDDFRYMLYDTNDFQMGELERAHDQQAVKEIRNYLNDGSNRYLFVQADHYRTERLRDGKISAAPDEQLVIYRRNDNTPPLEWNDESWIFISGPDVTSEDIELTFARGMLWPRTVGIITELSLEHRVPVHGQYIGPDFVKAMLRGIHQLAFVAFDRQLLLLWQPL